MLCKVGTFAELKVKSELKKENDSTKTILIHISEKWKSKDVCTSSIFSLAYCKYLIKLYNRHKYIVVKSASTNIIPRSVQIFSLMTSFVGCCNLEASNIQMLSLILRALMSNDTVWK